MELILAVQIADGVTKEDAQEMGDFLVDYINNDFRADGADFSIQEDDVRVSIALHEAPSDLHAERDKFIQGSGGVVTD